MLRQVQKSHPQDLLPLLKKVLKYLYHSNWDTRLAAAQAVEAILKNVSVWSPSEAKGGDVKVEDPEAKMTLAMFDVKNLLENDDEDLNDHQQETVNDKKFASEILVQWKKSNLSLVKTASALER